MKQKLLLVITKSNWGGAQKYVYDIATAKDVMEKYDVQVALGQSGELAHRLKEKEIIVHNLKRLNNSLNPIKLFFSVLELVSIIQKTQPDIIHTNSSFAGIAVSTAAFLARKKSVFTIHGWPFNEKRTTQQKFILKTAMFFVMLLHTRVIAVSRATLSQFPGSLRMRRKATVVHNGVNKQVYKNFNTVVPEWKKSGTQLVTIGELHTTKNHMLAIDALESLSKEFIEKNNVTYHIIGEGGERKHIEARIEKSHLKNRIYMYGAVPDASQYMPSFDIFVLCSISEAFCYVVIEAGMASLPVIATRVGGVPEIIKDDVTGVLVRSKSTKELALAIQDLVTHKSKRIKFSGSLKARVQEGFTKEKMIEGTMGVYAKLGKK